MLCISKASVGYCSVLLSVVLLALVAGSPSARTVPAKPDAGQEPTAAPILYDLTPAEGAIVSQDELSRAAATIETQHAMGVSWAGIYIDGHGRPSELMGPLPYLQSISADIGERGAGTHAVRVVATDSEGRAGSWVWRFTVV